MRRSKRKHNNRLRRKHLDKLARAKLALQPTDFIDVWYRNAMISLKITYDKPVVISNPDAAFWTAAGGSWKLKMPAGTQSLGDLYIPPELVKIREKVQALINAEKKRIRQEYLTTRTGKGMQDG